MPKVFISYSHKDENWKNRLQTQLAVLERQGLLSIWDDRQIAGGDDWLPAIEKAIESASIAILLISADFLSSKFILGKEVPPLLERRKKEGLRVIPLILKPCPWQTVDWLSKIQGRLDNKPLSGFDEHNQDHHLSELALEINKHIKSIPPDTKPDIAEPSARPTSSPQATYDPRNSAFLVPFRAKGKFMVGRDTALESVRQQLLTGRPTSIGQTVLFQGIGGLGKTQLAVEYAYRYRNEYPNGVYWVTADENIDAQLTQIAVDARWVAPESEHSVKLAVARNRLKTYSDCLIVFDNLESVDAIRDYLPNPSATPHILVTSRREQPDFADVELDLLSDKQSYAMLTQEAKVQPTNEAEESAVREIAATLSGLPLALELAGAFLARRHIGWCAYRDLLLEDLGQAFPTQLSSLTEHEADLFKTLRISEQEISEEPLLANVLDLLTWSGSSPMSLRLMAHLLDVKPTELYRALGLGVALRLLQQVPDSERYAVHRLVQEVRRQDRPLDQRLDWANAIAQRLGDWFEAIREDFRELPAFELEFEHLRAWQIHADNFSSIASVRLLWLQAYPAYHRGCYDESHQILRQALGEYEKQKLDSAVLKANLLSDNAYIFSRKGLIHESFILGEAALHIRLEHFGDKHCDVATSLSHLADTQRRLGHLDLALQFAVQALEMRRTLFGNKHSKIADSLINVSSCYAKLGEHHHALELSIQAFEILRELFGDKHPEVAISLCHLANCHGKLGNHNRALELRQQALKMLIELLGDRYPLVAVTLNDIGTSYAGLGDYHRALGHGTQAFEMLHELFGDKHPEIANSLYNIASYQEKLGNHHLVLDLGKQALGIYREFFGVNHPDTINSLRFVAERLYRNPFTARQGKTLVEEFLKHIPHDHPSRATVLDILNSRDGFRKQAKVGLSKKRKKKR